MRPILNSRHQEFPDLDLRAARLRAEREVIQEALVRSNNTLAVAARFLGVSRPTLYGLMEIHGFATEAARSHEGPSASAEATIKTN
jgi:two-component system, NtrC family, response regulator